MSDGALCSECRMSSEAFSPASFSRPVHIRDQDRRLSRVVTDGRRTRRATNINRSLLGHTIFAASGRNGMLVERNAETRQKFFPLGRREGLHLEDQSLV